MESAELCGEWFLRNQIVSDDETMDGLYWTYPYPENEIHIHDVAECIRGMLKLYEATKKKKYLDSALKAFKAVRNAEHEEYPHRLYRIYWSDKKRYGWDLHSNIVDSIYYRIYRVTGDEKLLEKFRIQCDEQLKYQFSDGGFYDNVNSRALMIRGGVRWYNYWMTMPYFTAYRIWKEKKYLELIRKSCEWIRLRQMEGGWFYYDYYPNGEPFRNLLDGVSSAAAVIVWACYMKVTGSREYVKNCEKAVKWLIDNQIRNDTLLNGAFKYTGKAVTVIGTAFAIRAYYALLGLEE